MGRDGTQDGAVDPKDDESDIDTNAVELCRIGERSPSGFCSETCHSRICWFEDNVSFSWVVFIAEAVYVYNLFRAQGSRGFSLKIW